MSRTGILYSAATISGAFSGFIAYGVQKDLTEKATGLEPWRWLFIIDGTAAMAVGIVTIIVIPRFADKMGGRKNLLLNATDIRVAIERAKGYNTIGAKVDFTQIWSTLKDPKSWLFACINAGVALGIASVGNFLPTFVRAFGYSASTRHAPEPSIDSKLTFEYSQVTAFYCHPLWLCYYHNYHCFLLL